MKTAKLEQDMIAPGPLSPSAANLLRDLDIFLDETGMSDPECCKRSGINREALSGLRNGVPVAHRVIDKLRDWLSQNGGMLTVIRLEDGLMRTVDRLPGDPVKRAEIATEIRTRSALINDRRMIGNPDGNRIQSDLRKDIEILDNRIAQLTERRAALMGKYVASGAAAFDPASEAPRLHIADPSSMSED